VHGIFKNIPTLLVLIILVSCGDDRSVSSSKEHEKLASVDLSVLSKTINSNPLFDAQGKWGPGYVDAKDPKGQGVVVGPGEQNKNVFAQVFDTEPGATYRVVARASSIGKDDAMGRIQVNWESLTTFISVSSIVFDVSLHESQHELIVTAPPGAVKGTLYVVGNGPRSIVRYSEMRLLGKELLQKEIDSNGDTKNKSIKCHQEFKLPPSENKFPRPDNLTPIDNTGKRLTAYESQYYFYHAGRAMQIKAAEKCMKFILFLMPDQEISILLPAISALRDEGIKVLAYSPTIDFPTGVNSNFYWQKYDLQDAWLI
jgi:hypothetical protein